MKRRILAAALAALCLGAASDPAERLPDPAQEARARELFRTLRCVVCQNESIDDSNAEIAGDLRRIVRAQIAQGRSNAEIQRFLVSRYGEFILLKPPFSPGNAVLWLTPALIVALGGGYLAWQARRARSDDAPALSDEEQARLDAMLDTTGAMVPPHNGPNNHIQS